MKLNRGSLTLYEGMQLCGMSYAELWLRQIGVGGTAEELEVEAYCLGLLTPDTLQHDVIAQALNEYFAEQGGDHPVAYADDAPRDDSPPAS